MAAQFRATPGELRGVSDDPHGAAAHMTRMMSALSAQLGGEGAAWGIDSRGHQFAGGANGVVAQHNWVEGLATADTGVLDDEPLPLGGASSALGRSGRG